MLMDMTDKNDKRQNLLKGIYQDAKLIEQVITNLLDNAVKHTTCEQAVTVCVSYLPDKAQVTVKDEGEGIAKEVEGNRYWLSYEGKRQIKRRQGFLCKI